MPLPSTSFNFTALCREGQLKEALHILLTTHNPPEDSSTYIQLLQTCILKHALTQGKKVHSFIAHRRFTFATRTNFHNKLIHMYVKCGSLVDARKVFNCMEERDTISWNTIIAAYRRHGYSQEAVTLFQDMQQTNIEPDKFTFASVLPACAKMGDLEQGMNIHQIIKDRGILSDVIVTSALVDMYAKCGSIYKAGELFDIMPHRDVISWNAMIAGYAQNGYVDKALETFKEMQRASVKPNSTTFSSVLPACAKMGALEQGMYIHQSIEDSGFLSDVTVATSLVDMYAKCGSIDKASEQFERMPQRDVISWNAMIAGYAQNGFIDKALLTFKQMKLAGTKPTPTTFASILPACAKIEALEQGMNIHQSLLEEGILSDVTVGNALIDMYAKCGKIDKAYAFFENMLQRNVVSWNTMITGYVQNGFVEKALQTFKQMQLSGVKPDSTTFVSILPACANLGALELGMGIHQSLIEGGFLSDVKVATAMVDMYAKCGIIGKARQLFEKIFQSDVISWNAMIAGYAQNGFVCKALETFKQMQLAGVKPNSMTFASILPACAKMGALEQGMEIHQGIMEGGFLSDIVIGNTLLDMYAKCGGIEKARELFDRMPQRNVVSWTSIIAGYVHNGVAEKALETFKQMQLAGVKPNSTTFASILPACAKMGAFEQAMDIHQSIKEGGVMSDVIVVNALVDIYAKCGRIDKACELFDTMPQRDVVTWNVMIAGYVQNGFVDKALLTFKKMQLDGVVPNSTTFASILPACAKVGALEQGIDIHGSIMEGGFLSDSIVATALVDMYAKCGSIDKGRVLFDTMPKKDVISWNAMIAGYAQNGLVEKALETFKEMQLAGVKPDSTAFSSILPACAKMGALEQGMDIHQSIKEEGFLSDIIVGNALVDMYAKCGSIDKARELFDTMPKRDVISWNAMIAGYAQNGFCKDALKVFELMHSGTHPDIASFACVLSACSHAGLVDEGCKHFTHMNNTYFITPTVDHYVCMVDLLARAGYLEDTLTFIIKMPVKPVVVVWMCFLGACRLHVNIGFGVFTAMLLFDLDPKNAATYVLLSNIYAEVGSWDEVQMVRRLMKDGGIKKVPGCSWIEGHKIVHAFCVGDRSHPQTHEIYATLEKLDWEMKAAGYCPDSRHLPNDVEEEEKEVFLCHHSEKLAIAFGLLNTSPGTTIRVVKNLRVCADCHTATKFISKIVRREIVVRDANRFHHFKQGQCSCGDYW